MRRVLLTTVLLGVMFTVSACSGNKDVVSDESSELLAKPEVTQAATKEGESFNDNSETDETGKYEKILAAASVSPGPLFVTFCQDGRVSAAVRTTGRNFFVPEKASAEGARARLTENLRKILAIVDEANPVAAAPAQEGEA